MMLWLIFFMPTFYLKGLTSFILKNKNPKEKKLTSRFGDLSNFSPNQKQLIVLFIYCGT